MGDLHYSKLLSMILEKAESLSREYGCKGVTRDYIVVAAIQLLSRDTEGIDEDEKQKALAMISRYSSDDSKLVSVLEGWRDREPTMTEKIMVTRHKGEATSSAKEKGLQEIPADLFLQILVKNETSGMAALHDGTPAPAPSAEPPKAAAPSPAAGTASAAPPAPAAPKPAYMSASKQDIASIVARTQHLHAELQKRVLGQSHAVSVFTSGYFNAELQAAIDKDRKRPRATFLFAGPPGCGKTFLAEQAADILGVQSKRFDMSGYVNPSATDDLCGYDKNYRSSKEGELTGFVNKNPDCILIFDEIEKASLEVILLFLQILDAGQLKDNRTEKNVSFKNTILIFTTNAGKELYEDKQDENLSLLHRDVILDTIKKEVKPKTQEPMFPPAICSRFASGNVVMFNFLRAHTLTAICRKRLNTHMENLNKAMGITIEMNPSIPTALLLAEGASADARMVNGRADAFFSGELYEMFRLLPKTETETPSEKIKKVKFTIDLENCPKEIRDLFIPVEQPHVAVFDPKGRIAPPAEADGPVLHNIQSYEEFIGLLDTERIEMLICDVDSSEQLETELLNWEDVATPERAFLLEVLKKHPSLPVVLYDDEADPFTTEEKDSYSKRGVRGFLFSGESDEDHPSMQQLLEEIFQQNKLSELARSNQLLRYETAQILNDDRTEAEIMLFDLGLEKAIKAEDSKNIMSLLSTPKETFDDIIGADEAKKELRFFVNYMNNPQKYRKSGAAAPKGVLLYGPPGTGKTMLAKAFAHESGATFISTVGSQFFQKYIGEGQALVRKLFATARRYAPSVLFIDEIDAIARSRTGRDTDMGQDTEQILTAFFAEMDGFSTDPTKPVFVLGATNYGMDSKLTLDPAMLRRFDRRLLIDLPTPENREKYLRLMFEKKPMFKGISETEIKNLTDRSTGMSLANLASVLDLAMRTALQNGKDVITDADLEEAFETFNGGEKKEWSEEIVLRTARHEAGHAIVSWITGEKPSYITIVSRGSYGGYMQHANQEERFGYTRREILNRIATSLGGRAAELVYYGDEEGTSTGPSSDLRNATMWAKRMLCEFGMDETCGLAVVDMDSPTQSGLINRRVNAILSEQLKRAIDIVSGNRDKVDALVAKLLEKNHLNQEEIEEVLA